MTQASPPTTTEITMVEPIQRESGSIEKLTLRKPCAGELRGLKIGDLITGETTAVLTVLPRIVEPVLTPPEINGLSCEDLAEIAGTIAGFFLTPAQKAMVQEMTGT